MQRGVLELRSQSLPRLLGERSELATGQRLQLVVPVVAEFGAQ